MSDNKIRDPGISGYISTNFEIFQNDFMAEVRELAMITEIPGFSDFIQRFIDYPSYLLNRKKVGNPLLKLLKASDGSRILDTSTSSHFVWDAIYTAHFAACCSLFNGSTLKENQFNSKNLIEMAQQYLSQYRQSDNSAIRSATLNLHSMDVVRTMQLLRSLRLVNKKPSSFVQLALGAGSGVKDMYNLHQLPVIEKKSVHGETAYTLTIHQQYIEHIIITDLDEDRDELYEKYNSQLHPPVYAKTADMMDLLSELPGTYLKKRNLITAIRIDHRMIPDVPSFLNRIAKIIEDKCDIILSMGAGNNIEEFKGRIDKLAEIFTALEYAKLQPILLKMHGPGSIEEQHKSLRYGNPSNSTFQILYCSINRSRLQKAYGK